MKRIALLMLSLVVLGTGCAPAYEKNEEVGVETTEQNQQEKAIVPKYSISEDYYRPLEKYKPSKSRGVITHQMANRFDIKEMEVGLRRHAKGVFDPKDYFFQEGQYLTDDILYDWLDRAKNEAETNGTPNGLNPSVKEDAGEEVLRDNPKYLSHILEQDYLKKNEEGDVVQLKGMTIGLAMKSQYQFQEEIGGPVLYEDIPVAEMLKEGKQIAQTVLERLRKMEDLQDVPIMFAIYREEEKGAMVPGNFVAKTTVQGSDMKLGSWEPIQEDYVLFPSDEASGAHPEDASLISDLQNDVAEYFPNYIGVVGKGFYIEDELRELTITIPIEFKGQTEVIGLTQYVYSIIVENFPNYFDLEVNIESHNGQESLISREAGKEEPYVHIYGQ
ncbi:CamS family sex pheromone protein [Pontibacillus yanchengensis]|uniref:CamS family sex pheromone protein n=1 Tax=Pontibacillus yanchengensis TaxID=462910 RepID=A0A6I5A5B8_9BACI|nr:CamS family sex pheromone protein [Pontibacillus yanchengensis]MYL35524.1 CamS family sex pheromone protein [Pontibacillus yanchengensis]